MGQADPGLGAQLLLLRLHSDAGDWRVLVGQIWREESDADRDAGVRSVNPPHSCCCQVCHCVLECICVPQS